MKLITAPDPRLRLKASPVEEINQEIQEILSKMAHLMYEHQGIGLAATQVGVLKRLIVIDIGQGLLKLINPEIIWKSDTKEKKMEACLSVPGQQGQVSRSCCIKVRFQKENGAFEELDADSLLGVCIQHEIDHLNGILYLDHLSQLKQQLILSRLRKQRNKS